jgi:hypothetical protein
MTSLARGDAAYISFGKENLMTPSDLIKLTPLMEITSGRPDVTIGVIDGPVAIGNPDLVHENIREVPGKISGRCVQSQSIACAHGTFVAGILCAKRNSVRGGEPTNGGKHGHYAASSGSCSNRL